MRHKQMSKFKIMWWLCVYILGGLPIMEEKRNCWRHTNSGTPEQDGKVDSAEFDLALSAAPLCFLMY